MVGASRCWWWWGRWWCPRPVGVRRQAVVMLRSPPECVSVSKLRSRLQASPKKPHQRALNRCTNKPKPSHKSQFDAMQCNAMPSKGLQFGPKTSRCADRTDLQKSNSSPVISAQKVQVRVIPGPISLSLWFSLSLSLSPPPVRQMDKGERPSQKEISCTLCNVLLCNDFRAPQ